MKWLYSIRSLVYLMFVLIGSLSPEVLIFKILLIRVPAIERYTYKTTALPNWAFIPPCDDLIDHGNSEQVR